MEPCLDWAGAVASAASGGELMVFLLALPRTRWGEWDMGGRTLLHYACTGPNVAAVTALLARGLDVNERDALGWRPVHHAAWNRQTRALELLCAAGASLRLKESQGFTAIDKALMRGSSSCVRVLMAHGVRLSTVNVTCRHYVTPQLEAFERALLQCRAAVVAMLRVKKPRRLVMWDKYLLALMARDVWATRYDVRWVPN